MGKVYVIGVGMTKFEKPETRDDPVQVLAKEALEKALIDAKISYNDIQEAYVSYIYGESTTGQRVLYEAGMTGIPIYNINNNCASGSSSLLLAKEAIEYGIKDCVLSLGFDKMKKGILTFSYSNMTSPLKPQMKKFYSINGKVDVPIAPALFGGIGIEHMRKYGTQYEHFAKIAYKNHKHGSVNPYSQSQKVYTMEEILNSRKIYGPLTKLQCCTTTDGAAAAVLASERFVIKNNLQKQAVEILGMEMATDLPSTFTDNSIMTICGCEFSRLAAYKVFRKTKVHPTNVNVIELHDCFSSHELVLYEILGLCPPGKAPELIDRGDNTYGGKYVVNPSGGLIGKGHPLGATGIAQCVELCWQLRGEAGQRQVLNAKLALQHNFGWGGAAIVGIYTLGFLNQNIDTNLNINNVIYFQKMLEYINCLNKSSNIQIKVKKLSGETYSCNLKILNDKNYNRENTCLIFNISEEDLKELLQKYKKLRQAEYDKTLKLSITSDVMRLCTQSKL